MVMSFNYDLQLIAAEDPYPVYRRLRDEDPVHFSATENLWVLTRFADVKAALLDHGTWSSQQRGNLVNDMSERIGRTLGTTDPPEHTFARHLVDKAFTRTTIQQLRPKMERIARKLVQRAADRGSFEFVDSISAPFNASILGVMFGVADDDFLTLRRCLDDFFRREDPFDDQEPAQVIAMRDLHKYLDQLVKQRMDQPADDLLTGMLYAEEGGRRLELEQVVVTTMTFLTAGFESTNNLFTNLARALALHPEAFAELCAAPDLITSFIEEGMRWDAPAQGFVRCPQRDVQLHDQVVPEGSQVLLHIGSANRDEREFVDPDRLDIHRQQHRHLGMGLGIHFCVGAPLGRTMAQVLFEELLNTADCWEVDLDQAVRVTTPNFRGFSRLPLRIR